MNKYLVIYDFESYEIFEAVSIYDLIKQFATYTGCCNYLFEMAIASLSKEKDFVDMYNHFATFTINAIYRIDKTIYEEKKK